MAVKKTKKVETVRVLVDGRLQNVPKDQIPKTQGLNAEGKIISKTDPEYITQIAKNPFFYNKKKALVHIETLDEFRGLVNKEIFVLKTVVQTPKYDYNKKVKVVNSIFKHWYNEFDINITNMVENVNEDVVVTKNIKYKVAPSWRLLCFVGIFVLSLLIVSVYSDFWHILAESSVFMADLRNSYEIYIIKNVNVVNVINYIAIYACLLFIVMELLFKTSINSYYLSHIRVRKTIEESKNEMRKKVMKSYNYAYNYYMNNLKEKPDGIFDSILIDDVCNNQVDIEKLKKMCCEMKQKNIHFEDKHKAYKWKRNIVLYLTLVAFCGALGVFIFNLVTVAIR